ncbi:MAG: AbrB/MazE/SpoVT family DNA-binding domain-containing protein [Sphingomonadaceae bacterium]|nr:AbrB/MazE/SpoVT family DNA-binding domain-containing protein [Sphingomonadaceae bacterium]
MKYESNMTSKGQVTIPKDLRDALGLKPGQKVGFELATDGTIRIRKPDKQAERERRIAEFEQRVKEAQKLWKPGPYYQDMDPVEFQRMMRGEGPEV